VTRHHGQRPRPMAGSAATLAVKFAAITRGALNVVLRFSEAFGQGPQMVTNPMPGAVDVGWRWSSVPDGLTTDTAGADLYLRLTFDPMNQGGMSMRVFYGPQCPDAAEKHKVVADVLELVKIEMQQKGLAMPDSRGGL